MTSDCEHTSTLFGSEPYPIGKKISFYSNHSKKLIGEFVLYQMVKPTSGDPAAARGNFQRETTFKGINLKTGSPIKFKYGDSNLEFLKEFATKQSNSTLHIDKQDSNCLGLEYTCYKVEEYIPPDAFGMRMRGDDERGGGGRKRRKKSRKQSRRRNKKTRRSR